MRMLSRFPSFRCVDLVSIEIGSVILVYLWLNIILIERVVSTENRKFTDM